MISQKVNVYPAGVSSTQLFRACVLATFAFLGCNEKVDGLSSEAPNSPSDAEKRASLHAKLDEGDIHDPAIGLCGVGDETSVPHLINALKSFASDGDFIECTQLHCVEALQRTTNNSPGEDNHSGKGRSFLCQDGRGAWERPKNWRNGPPNTMLNGQVISTAGTPIDDATVSAQCWTGETSVLPVETKSNHNGEFSLSPISPSADCRIGVIAEGYYGGWIDISDKSPRENIQFVLGEGVTLSGRAVTRSGVPILNARIRLERLKDDPPLQPGKMEVLTIAESTSDASGHFITEHVAPGAYHFNIYVDGEGYNYHQRSVSEPVHVQSDVAIEGIDILFNDPDDECIQGFVRDENGEPIPFVVLDAITYSGEHWGAKTDLLGHYRIIGVGNHSLTINCTPPSCDGLYPSVQIEHVPVGTHNADITMPHSGRIQGRVRDNNSGQFLKDAEVRITRLEPQYNSFPGWYTDHPSERTDDGGAFQFTEVLPGKLVLSISASDYVDEQMSNIIVEPGKSTPELDIQLIKGTTPKLIPPEDPAQCAVITGTVLNVNQTPIQAEQGIYLEYLDKPVHEVSAGYVIHDGQYTLERLLPGTYEIEAWVRGDGYSMAQSRTIQAHAGEITRVDFVLNFPVNSQTSSKH